MINIKRLKQSFQYAGRGILKMYKEEQNLQLQLKIAILVIIVALFIGVNKLEFIMLIFTIGLVFLAETINSVVERIVDILKPRLDASVKEIKDIMAGAVLIVSVMAVIIGILIFFV